MSDHDGHTINVGPVAVGETLPKADPHPCSCRACASARMFTEMRDEMDRLRAENALLRGDNATLGSTVTELRDQLREALGEPT